MEKMKAILENSTRIAVVGLSPKPDRPSNDVARYLMSQGYEIIPVNPGQTEILGQVCYPSLREIPGPVDVVDIFRRSEYVVPIVEEAIAIGAKYVWMQEGIVNSEAAELAEKHNIPVVMDFCMKVAHIMLHDELKQK
ncbi:MAG: CoA-binding protein [Calditrichaeota bacterium]|nr:CoA-binding protein [Calditrichota bacterium]